MSFSIGQSISVLDTADDQVRRCKVVAVNGDDLKVQIHYINWNSSSDEWLDFDSDRILSEVRENTLVLSGRKEVMGALLLNADEISKQVLSSYPIISDSDEGDKNLNKFSVANLESCARYLKVALKDTAGKKLFNKKSLVKQLVLSIEALMPTKCEECSSTYKISLEDVPLFKCHICLRGSHDCEQMKRVNTTLAGLRVNGIVWLCASCSERHSGAPSLNVGDSSPHSVDNTGTSVVESEITDSGDLVNGNSEQLSHAGSPTVTVICKKYRKGNCPHGLRGKKLINGNVCRYQHPRSCNKFCAFGSRGPRGCKDGASCQYFHPMLCRSSLKNRECTNEKCSFVHLKGTVRRSPVVQEPSQNLPKTRDEVTSSTRSPFLKLESLIETMDSKYQKQISQLQSQLEQILKSGLTTHLQPLDPMAYYHQQTYRHQKSTADPYQGMAQMVPGQGMINPSFSQVVQGPMRDLNQRNTPQLYC